MNSGLCSPSNPMQISEPTLKLLDALPLECDGMTRIASILLERDGVPHTCYVGALSVNDSPIMLHYWISFPDGHVLDLRARMWLRGDDVPHGYFIPSEAHQYDGHAISFKTQLLPARIFLALTGKPLESFPPIFTDKL